ncbi:MAG: mannose-1-phosphate guanylyltransferase/mannose-6-phosphate isomerase [Candidatus Moranbacteria bacterium]|nr:mannose-1-phosphate guanylyltransferase/mannose-6-phosphate isomerase [Candidatus Moranbacteria bacterium]
MYSVILCGGSGTRLWPLSRKNFAKQFLSLYSDRSLLQETYLRMRDLLPKEKIFFVTSRDNLFNVFNQIKEVEKDYRQEQILTEPASLNTAPAITYAVKHLSEKAKVPEDEPVLFLPSDHYIGNKKKYLEVVEKATNEVGSNIGTIGITPAKPETGYGYIKKGEKANSYYKVLEFKEKPDKATAEKYLESGEYVWNSGMYIFNARTFTEELRAYSPEIYSLMAQSYESFLERFSTLPSISIDYAISEKSKKVIVFEGEFSWNDIGSFDSLAELALKDPNPKHIGIDSRNIFVHSDSNRLVATLGVEDMNIIETSDSILVQKQGRGEDVKKIVEYLKEKNLKELEHNIVVQRPWGKYEVLIDQPTYKVKKILVYPGAKLSLQAHNRRVEHWVVVKGTAGVVNGDKKLILHENESTFIPRLAKHRLENPGEINLEMVEVQTGEYLEEDDIIRYDDVYNRNIDKLK